MDKREKCFADYGRGCSALTNMNCKGCNFYKSETQYQEESIAIDKLLRKRGWVWLDGLWQK